MIPTSLKNHLAAVGEQFGGFEVVSKILPADQIYYLATFPGPFFVTSPWSLNLEGYQVDFSYAGHTPGENYQVFNREYKWLFSGNSRLFGGSEQEQELVQSAYHGEYFHVELYTETGPQLVILWVCKEVAPVIRERYLTQLRQQAKPKITAGHEIFIDCKGLDVKIYVGYGDSLTGYELKQRGQVVEVSNRIVRLTPQSTTWYGFEVAGQWWQTSLTGEGEQRWSRVGDIHRFDARNSYRSTTSALSVENFTTGSQNFCHLFGTLKPIQDIVGGSSISSAVSDRPPVTDTSSVVVTAATQSLLAIRSNVVNTGRELDNISTNHGSVIITSDEAVYSTGNLTHSTSGSVGIIAEYEVDSIIDAAHDPISIIDATYPTLAIFNRNVWISSAPWVNEEEFFS